MLSCVTMRPHTCGGERVNQKFEESRVNPKITPHEGCELKYQINHKTGKTC